MEKGDITYRTILEVFPFNNEMCVIEVTGQQILDALEWGCSKLPDEFTATACVKTLGVTKNYAWVLTHRWIKEGLVDLKEDSKPKKYFKTDKGKTV